MPVKILVRRNFYRDSVTLMRLAAELEAMAGIEGVSAIMASPANLDLLAESEMAVDPSELAIVNVPGWHRHESLPVLLG